MSKNTITNIFTMATTNKLLVILTVLAISWASASAQNCGCAFGLCCSQYGYCGASSAYCGVGCRSGPCQGTATLAQGGGGGGKPGDIITRSFFNGVLSEGGSCSGKGRTFYNYDAFVNAANSFPGFGTTGAADVRKREMAAFFANVMHETGSLCFINEQTPRAPGMKYCDPSKGPCAAGKDYHGRGPLQLSWNYNYGPAGKDIGFDGINNPDIVAQDATISFKAAVWFWMKNSNCHTAITSGQGFGGTIKAINSMECGGGKPSEVRGRVGFYRRFSSQLGVDVGPNVSC